MSNQQMIVPNRLEQATQELSSINLGSYKIPKEIQKAEKEYYVIVGLNASLVGLQTIVEARTVFYDVKAWDRMAKDLESKHPMFTTMGANQFKQVVILNNPRMAAASMVEDLGFELFVSNGRLTDPKKLAIDRLMEEGKGAEDEGINEIAKEVNVSFVKVKEYIKSF